MLACRYVKLHEAVPPLIEFLRNLSRVALTKLFSKKWIGKDNFVLIGAPFLTHPYKKSWLDARQFGNISADVYSKQFCEKKAKVQL